MDLKPGQLEDHSRTIIHIDIDCFYAQVEMIKNPDLCNKPLGIQQKNIVVTSNYIARQYGIKKCMLIGEAQKLCPDLILVNGEDLHDYRQTSYNITAYLQKYTPLVERLGLDENYVDVSKLVNNRMKVITACEVVGHVFGSSNDVCQCGCYERLKVASVMAQEIRKAILDEFKLTCCAGIGHNKLLAKLVCATHKPNQQTLVYPNCAFELLQSLNSVSDIPGIGRMAANTLDILNIKTVEDLQNCNREKLKSAFGEEKAKTMHYSSYGLDCTPVKPSGKPQSIGLEDSCKSITVVGEVKTKLNQLLKRLLVLLSEDKRLPRGIKLTVRKFDNTTKSSHRETRQCNISPSLFTMGSTIELPEQSERKLMSIIMNLFNKIVDVNKSYHVTLLGLSFTKFLDRLNGKSSITAFLKKNVEVQSITNIENKCDTQYALMDYSSSSQHDFNTDGSESEYEPSPKKSKFTTLIAKRRYFDAEDCPSPSKLKVAELHLNTKETEIGEMTSETNKSFADSNQNVRCPSNVDVDVFKELPMDLQQELWDNYKHEMDRNHRLLSQNKKQKVNTLLNYLVRN